MACTARIPRPAELPMARADRSVLPVEIEAAGRMVPITNPNKADVPVGRRRQNGPAHQAGPRPVLRGGRRTRSCARSPIDAVLLERYPERRPRDIVLPEADPRLCSSGLARAPRPSSTINGTPSRALVIADLAHVLWAANQGVPGLHVWPYRASGPGRRPTRCELTSTRVRVSPST